MPNVAYFTEMYGPFRTYADLIMIVYLHSKTTAKIQGMVGKQRAAVIWNTAPTRPRSFLVLPGSGSEPIPNLNRTRTEPELGFGEPSRTGPNLRSSLGFAFFEICPNLNKPDRTRWKIRCMLVILQYY